MKQTVNVMIKDGSGNVVFERANVEAPSSWSQQAIDIAASKFFTINETSVYQMVDRIVRAICIKQPWVYEVIPTFEEDLREILIGQRASFNSPVWFNLGVDDKSALSACFILGLEDTMESILDTNRIAGEIFRHGGGRGINWSKLRGKNEPLSKGGKASGVLSFLGGYDSFAGIIKSGGKTRRAASMDIVNDNHPDVMEFVKFKPKEERKLKDLIDTGNWGSPYDMESEAAATVKGQNANLSVRCSDKFMHAVLKDEDWALVSSHTKEVVNIIKAKDLWNEIVGCAWTCGDPGLQFDDIINKYNPLPNRGRINSSNPCISGNDCLLTSHGYVKFEDLFKRHKLPQEDYASITMIHPDDGKPIQARIYNTGIKKVVAVSLSSASFTNEGKYGEVICTPDHLWPTGKGVDVQAKDLLGKDVWSYRDSCAYRCTAVTELAIEEEVYDFQVVGDIFNNKMDYTPYGVVNGFVVHNCSEFMFFDDSACNLASLNLLKYLDENNKIDEPKLMNDVRVIITAQDAICSISPYPTEKIAANSALFRPLGLGYAGLGSLFMRRGYGYGSNHARELAKKITKIITTTAWDQSHVLYEHLGANLSDTDQLEMTAYIKKFYDKDIVGVRNSQVTLLAPCGCLVGDTLVLSSEGLLPIGEFGNKEGDTWQDIDTEIIQESITTNASKFYINGQQPIIRIKTKDGHTISGTENHKIRVINQDGDYVWKELREVSVEDIAVLKLGGHEELLGNKEYVNIEPFQEYIHANAVEITQTDSINEDFAELLGFFTGNGYTKKKGGFHLVVDTAKPDLVEYLKAKIFKVFGIYPTTEERQGCVVLNCFSRDLYRWFEKYGFAKAKGAHGEGSSLAEIPIPILRSRTSVLCSYLKGLFEADGTIAINGATTTVELTTVSVKLASQIQSALDALGIRSSIFEYNNIKGSLGKRTKYRLRVRSNKDTLIFKEKIGFISNFKTERMAKTSSYKDGKCSDPGNTIVHEMLLKEFGQHTDGIPNEDKRDIMVRINDGKMNLSYAQRQIDKFPQLANSKLAKLLALGNIQFIKVISIKELESQDTYDISVPENNCYIAGGFISHNTIGFTMDCDTTGIEPFMGLKVTKKLIGGSTMVIVAKAVEEGLKALGYDPEAGRKYLESHDTLKGFIQDHHLSVFATALGDNVLTPEDHVNMVAAVQPYLSGSISKTVNVPNNYTKDDISNVFKEAWRQGVKCISIYRDGSKNYQPVSSGTTSDKKPGKGKRKMPSTRQSITHKIDLAADGIEAYVTMGFYDDGSPGEIFITISNGGPTLQGLTNMLGIMVSMMLQSGIPIDSIIEKMKHQNFSPNGWTTNPDIPMCNSIVDYVAVWMEQTLKLNGHERKEIIYGRVCSTCGSDKMHKNGTCYSCLNCGSTTGCG